MKHLILLFFFSLNIYANTTIPYINDVSYQYYLQLQKQGEVRLQVVRDDLLELTLVPKRDTKSHSFTPKILTPQEIKNFKLYTLHNAQGDLLHIKKISLKRRTIYAPLKESDLRIAQKIYIETKSAFVKGQRYTLTLQPPLLKKEGSYSFSFDPKHALTPLIHLDALGYTPLENKVAYLGLHMGDAEVDMKDTKISVVRLSDAKVLYSAKAKRQDSLGWRKNYTSRPYSNVYAFDFSTIQTPGKYFLQHSSGVSLVFEIDADVYRKTLNTLSLGMYHQRRGEALKLPYTRFERKSTIENHTYVYDSKDLDPFLTHLKGWGDGVKYPTTLEGEHVAISGGHMDAGDYAPYTYNSALSVWTMVSTLDLFGQSVAHDNLGIPESGDGVSDILQELLIELKWLKEMQDRVDGGVFGMSKAKGMAYQNTMPGEDRSIRRYLAPKDTITTAVYAAALARAARSPTLQAYDKELTQELQKRAIRAGRWLEQNRGFHGYYHYGIGDKRGGDKGDEHIRAFAAIELYALTGAQQYHQDLLQYYKPELRQGGAYIMNKGYGYVTRTLALWDHDGIEYQVDRALKKRAQKRFKEAVDGYILQSQRTPYDLILNDVVKRWNRVGWYFPLSFYGWDLLVAAELYDAPKYRDLACKQLHFTLGANPSNMTYITGLGVKRLHSIVDQKSLYDGIKEPIAGIPISPVVTDFTYNGNYKHDISLYTYPPNNLKIDEEGDVYPLLETAYDGWNISGEFTIEKLVRMQAVLAILTPRVDKLYAYPRFKIVSKWIDGGYDFRLQSDLSIEKCGVRWYANDEIVSTQDHYRLKEGSQQMIWKISAEVLCDSGLRWYESSLLNTQDYTLGDRPTKGAKAEETTLLYPLDGSLEEVRQRATPLRISKGVSFEADNLFWMREPKGKALCFKGQKSYAELIFSLNAYLKKGETLADIKALSVEGMFYIDSFDDPSKDLLNIFSLRQSWRAGMRLGRYGWQEGLSADLGKVHQSSKVLSEVLSRHQWHHIKMVYDKEGYRFYIDNKLLFIVDSKASGALFDQRDITLSFGAFYGCVDDVQLKLQMKDKVEPSEQLGRSQ